MTRALAHRLTAIGCALLVLALTIFAASPDLHGKLHRNDAGPDDSCAVVLFAGGVSAPGAPIVAVAPHLVLDCGAVRTPPEVDVLPPRFLKLPERAPPGLG